MKGQKHNSKSTLEGLHKIKKNTKFFMLEDVYKCFDILVRESWESAEDKGALKILHTTRYRKGFEASIRNRGNRYRTRVDILKKKQFVHVQDNS